MDRSWQSADDDYEMIDAPMSICEARMTPAAWYGRDSPAFQTRQADRYRPGPYLDYGGGHSAAPLYSSGSYERPYNNRQRHHRYSDRDRSHSPRRDRRQRERIWDLPRDLREEFYALESENRKLWRQNDEMYELVTVLKDLVASMHRSNAATAADGTGAGSDTDREEGEITQGQDYQHQHRNYDQRQRQSNRPGRESDRGYNVRGESNAYTLQKSRAIVLAQHYHQTLLTTLPTSAFASSTSTATSNSTSNLNSASSSGLPQAVSIALSALASCANSDPSVLRSLELMSCLRNLAWQIGNRAAARSITGVIQTEKEMLRR